MPDVVLSPWDEQPLIDNQHHGALQMVRPERPRVRLVAPLQLPDMFAPEQFFQSDDLDESTHFCAEHFAYSQSETSIAQISVDEELLLSVDGQHYHITEKAHNDLCRMLGIPITFSYAIPI